MKGFYKFLPIIFLPLFLFSGVSLFSQCPSGGVEIFSQQSVTDFQTAYPNCTTISGDLVINDSSDVVNGVYTADITSLQGLSKLKTITGGLTIRSCSQLTSLVGLDNITSIGTDLFVIENDRLKNFSGLGKLTTVPNSITIRLNDSLENLFGLGTITGAITGQIKITDNPVMDSITPLNGITSTGSDVTIKRNNLSNLSGLENITTIGGFLNVRQEPSLTSISHLLSLTSVGSNTLNISNNPLLTNLTGLDSVTSINGSLYLSYNTELGDCSAVCHILVNDQATSYVVGNNKQGSTCQYLTALQTACVPLPIELTYFSSHQEASQVYLEWETSSEINNSGQFVEKSQNGRDWEDIAWIDGYGTTQDLHAYHFTDRMPYKGINYYRLKQVNYDGKAEYSHVISEYFSRKGSTAGVQMYPNPVRDLLFIQHQLAGDVKVTIFDIYGKVVLAGDLGHSVDVSGLPEGVYYVQVYDEFQALEWQKVVVLR